MQQPRRPLDPTRLCGWPAIALAGLLTACGGGGTAEPTSASTATAPATPADTAATGGTATTLAAVTADEGRLLASNCFQCHGTGGTGGFDSIQGSEAGEVLEFLTDNPSSNIMAAHAQGYTREQLLKIIAYLQQ